MKKEGSNKDKSQGTEDNTKYVLLQNDYMISYNNDKCFINEVPYVKEEGDISSPQKIAEELKRRIYTDFLRKTYKNIVVLTAAGTSLDNGSNKGKTRDGLWGYCCNDIKAILKLLLPWNLILKKVLKDKDIEGFLSYVILYEKLNGELKNDKGEFLKQKLEHKIAEACDLTLDLPAAPHKDFLDKITSRKSNEPRVQLFTTNYDTLFEQAANEGGFVVIDGFSFTQPRMFAGKWFDLDIVNREKTRLKQEESFISKVLHLYKLHGSLNWTKVEVGEATKIQQQDSRENPVIIYPASEKYESSYEQPYFEMMSRFQQALRKENTLLIVIGFGFQDKHIKNVIIEAVEQNSNFQLLIVNYNGSEGISPYNMDSFFIDVKKMKVKRKVNIIFDTFKDFSAKFPENRSYLNHSEDERI